MVLDGALGEPLVWLDAQEALLDGGIGAQRFGCPLELDAPLIHHVEPVGEHEGDLEDLLDQQDGGAAPVDLAQDLGEAPSTRSGTRPGP